MLPELLLAALTQLPIETPASVTPPPCDSGTSVIPISGFPLVSEVDRSTTGMRVSFRLEIAGGIADRNLIQLGVYVVRDEVTRILSPKGWRGRVVRSKGRPQVVEIYWRAQHPVDLRAPPDIAGFGVLLPNGASGSWFYDLEFSDGTTSVSGLRGGCVSLGLASRGLHGD